MWTIVRIILIAALVGMILVGLTMIIKGPGTLRRMSGVIIIAAAVVVFVYNSHEAVINFEIKEDTVEQAIAVIEEKAKSSGKVNIFDDNSPWQCLTYTSGEFNGEVSYLVDDQLDYFKEKELSQDLYYLKQINDNTDCVIKYGEIVRRQLQIFSSFEPAAVWIYKDDVCIQIYIENVLPGDEIDLLEIANAI